MELKKIIKQIFCRHKWVTETIWEEDYNYDMRIRTLSPVKYKKCTKCGKVIRLCNVHLSDDED